MGIIETQLNTIKSNYDQADIALKYRDIFDTVYSRTKKLDIEIEQVSSDIKFTNIPTEVKQALNAYWQALKAFNTTIEANASIMELLDWK